jgi:hypothetical protein
MAAVVDIVDQIEELFSKEPDKRKKTEHKEWKDTINKVIQDCNKLCKFKMYDIIKK